MFLFRAAFWISLTVMFMPTDERRQAELYGKATAALQWTVTFCDRNAQLCVKSADTWQTFKHKADFGARLAGDLIQKGMKGNIEPVSAPSAAPMPDVRPGPVATPGTIAPEDLQARSRSQQPRPRA